MSFINLKARIEQRMQKGREKKDLDLQDLATLAFDELKVFLSDQLHHEYLQDKTDLVRGEFDAQWARIGQELQGKREKDYVQIRFHVQHSTELCAKIRKLEDEIEGLAQGRHKDFMKSAEPYVRAHIEQTSVQPKYKGPGTKFHGKTYSRHDADIGEWRALVVKAKDQQVALHPDDLGRLYGLREMLAEKATIANGIESLKKRTGEALDNEEDIAKKQLELDTLRKEIVKSQQILLKHAGSIKQLHDAVRQRFLTSFEASMDALPVGDVDVELGGKYLDRAAKNEAEGIPNLEIKLKEKLAGQVLQALVAPHSDNREAEMLAWLREHVLFSSCFKSMPEASGFLYELLSSLESSSEFQVEGVDIWQYQGQAQFLSKLLVSLRREADLGGKRAQFVDFFADHPLEVPEALGSVCVNKFKPGKGERSRTKTVKPAEEPKSPDFEVPNQPDSPEVIAGRVEQSKIWMSRLASVTAESAPSLCAEIRVGCMRDKLLNVRFTKTLRNASREELLKMLEVLQRTSSQNEDVQFVVRIISELVPTATAGEGRQSPGEANEEENSENSPVQKAFDYLNSCRLAVGGAVRVSDDVDRAMVVDSCREIVLGENIYSINATADEVNNVVAFLEDSITNQGGHYSETALAVLRNCLSHLKDGLSDETTEGQVEESTAELGNGLQLNLSSPVPPLTESGNSANEVSAETKEPRSVLDALVRLSRFSPSMLNKAGTRGEILGLFTYLDRNRNEILSDMNGLSSQAGNSLIELINAVQLYAGWSTLAKVLISNVVYEIRLGLARPLGVSRSQSSESLIAVNDPIESGSSEEQIGRVVENSREREISNQELKEDLHRLMDLSVLLDEENVRLAKPIIENLNLQLHANEVGEYVHDLLSRINNREQIIQLYELVVLTRPKYDNYGSISSFLEERFSDLNADFVNLVLSSPEGRGFETSDRIYTVLGDLRSLSSLKNTQMNGAEINAQMRARSEIADRVCWVLNYDGKEVIRDVTKLQDLRRNLDFGQLKIVKDYLELLNERYDSREKTKAIKLIEEITVTKSVSPAFEFNKAVPRASVVPSVSIGEQQKEASIIIEDGSRERVKSRMGSIVELLKSASLLDSGQSLTEHEARNIVFQCRNYLDNLGLDTNYDYFSEIANGVNRSDKNVKADLKRLRNFLLMVSGGEFGNGWSREEEDNLKEGLQQMAEFIENRILAPNAGQSVIGQLKRLFSS